MLHVFILVCYGADSPVIRVSSFAYTSTSSPTNLPTHRNDPTPDRGSQIPRAASLIVSSLGFIHDLRTGQLSPDTVRGTPLDMDQYHRLFGTARIPTEVSFKQLEPCLEGRMVADVDICLAFRFVERV